METWHRACVGSVDHLWTLVHYAAGLLVVGSLIAAGLWGPLVAATVCLGGTTALWVAFGRSRRSVDAAIRAEAHRGAALAEQWLGTWA